jgi:hypothetical protein
LGDKDLWEGLTYQLVTFDDRHGREDSAKIEDATTDITGTFTSKGTTPYKVGKFEFCANFRGSSNWHPSGSSNKMKNNDRSLKFLNNFSLLKDKFVFGIDQKQPSESNAVFYSTRLRKMHLSVSSGNYKNENFDIEDTFRPRQVITFLVKVLDKEIDKPICSQPNIELKIFTGNEKETVHLPITDNHGTTYTSIIAPKVASDA